MKNWNESDWTITSWWPWLYECQELNDLISGNLEPASLWGHSGKLEEIMWFYGRQGEMIGIVVEEVAPVPDNQEQELYLSILAM